MPIIEVTNLHKRYRDEVAVRDVSFTVEAGEIFGILGPNGAGKTTTVECITGLRRPDAGTVRTFGLDPQRDGDRLRGRVGVQLQESELPDRLRVWEALDLYASFYPDPVDPVALIEEWGLTDSRNTPFGNLSGGQKQRLFIALSLVGNPEVAVLDELTTGLDPHARRDAWNLVERIRASGVTVVLVSHFMDEVERLCDRVAVFADGSVTALDSPARLVAEAGRERQIRFRCPASLPDGLLANLPGVSGVTTSGPQVVVTGDEDALLAVAATLARHRITVTDLRLDQPSLEDAFVALTGRTFES